MPGLRATRRGGLFGPSYSMLKRTKNRRRAAALFILPITERHGAADQGQPEPKEPGRLYRMHKTGKQEKDGETW